MAFGFDYAGLTAINPIILSILIVWALIWKGLALWYSARNRQKIWFVVVLILNTMGILPIIYLLFFRRKRIPGVVKQKNVAKKTNRKKR